MKFSRKRPTDSIIVKLISKVEKSSEVNDTGYDKSVLAECTTLIFKVLRDMGRHLFLELFADFLSYPIQDSSETSAVSHNSSHSETKSPSLKYESAEKDKHVESDTSVTEDLPSQSTETEGEISEGKEMTPSSAKKRSTTSSLPEEYANDTFEADDLSESPKTMLNASRSKTTPSSAKKRSTSSSVPEDYANDTFEADVPSELPKTMPYASRSKTSPPSKSSSVKKTLKEADEPRSEDDTSFAGEIKIPL